MRALSFLVLAACGRTGFDPLDDARVIDAPVPGAVVEIGAGGGNACALLGSGALLCWGAGDLGQLGDGTATARATPGLVPLPIATQTFEINDAGECALAVDGTTRCWGRNDNGQLGLGGSGIVNMPTLASAPDVASFAIGNFGACIVRRSGQVACAGNPPYLGTTGASTTTFTDVPGVIAQSATFGDSMLCALLLDGSVTCWGDNLHGQLGNGALGGVSSVPVPGPPGPYTKLVAGDYHVCGLRVDRGVDCWGANESGELGNGTTGDRSTAVRASNITDAIDLACGSFTTCVLHETGTVSCWGDNASGELGDGTPGDGTNGDRGIPGPVSGLTDVIEIDAHTSEFICARKRDASVWCWGNNEFGQIGQEPVGGESRVPVRVPVGL